jgi:outer membrane cobalamin receptor
MRRLLLFNCFVFICYLSGIGQAPTFTIKGKVLDASTKEQLTGATIQLTGFGRSTRAKLDGSFELKHIAPGTYTISFHYIGYQDKDTTIAVTGNMVFELLLANTTSALSDVTVHGKRDAESDAFARKTEKNAEGIMNIVSAKAIQSSPDITVANVLQRVSGVSIERSSNGDGRYAIIRGMDQRYNYTLVNGIKIPSPDNKFRYVPLDIFPSDLIERVEVHKTLAPDMEGDAIGGVVNMVMKNAPNAFYFKASASAGMSQTLLDHGYDKFPVSAINRQSPFQLHGKDYQAVPTDFTRDNLNYTHVSAPVNTIATLAIGNRFLNNKLGAILGASYQNIYKGYSNVYIPAEPLAEDGSFLVKHVNVRQYSNHLTRSGANLKLDYVINPDNKISLYNLYINLKDAQARLTSDTLMPPPRTQPGTGQIWYYGRSKYQEQSIYNSTLQGNHKLSSRFLLDWSAVYSKASNHIPDWAEYEYDGGIYPQGVANNEVQKFDRAWWRNNDRDLAGYLNLHYTSTWNAIPFTVSVGGLYRDKHRTNYYDNYTLAPVTPSGGGKQLWVDIYHFNWFVQTPGGSASDANNYTANEKISAVYGMVKFKVNKLETTAGVRMENTNQDYATNLPPTEEGKTGSASYTDILPNINFKYLLNNNTNLRLTYFGSINRPGFFEIVPYHNQGDEFQEKGNFHLQHATAHNIDLRYELFPKFNEQILIGAFYKAVQNPIEYGFSFTGNQADAVYQPNNFGNATNYGFELVYEKYLGNIGFRGNYTYTHSAITTNKVQPFVEPNGFHNRNYPGETRPLQGQSAHIANAALLYKNTKSGTELQFNWQFTGKRIVLVSPYYGMDYWQKGMHLFDVSGEQRLVKRIALFAKVQNLFNATSKVYLNKLPSNIATVPLQDPASGKMMSQMSQYGQNYQLGIRFDFTK